MTARSLMEITSQCQICVYRILIYDLIETHRLVMALKGFSCSRLEQPYKWRPLQEVKMTFGIHLKTSAILS